ncbi:alpha/beta fold hydrolase [Caldisalinibacter kiritimatiensis]|uniref:Alpha/beta hydrolase superfamily protein n=1 Tax=Caldisalinibacter kiritimatiensis TaxID=1304284 RepID=R1CNQ8_9FIRM|nr:alpha/beta hydrolase [Caldisalinibacter kiritimatiensis]EOD00336.1 Alpha/beta hydrolase superfamily protein [Caldisalinibacter kiritimatiensis]
MPYLSVNDKNIYYEMYGEGEPLVVLNGIMMSTASWQAFIEPFSKQYKLVLMDFVDQGKSEKVEEIYTQDLQAEVLKGLIDKLGFTKVHLLGISYGGEVALKFALKYQDKINSLILSNTTSYTNELLKDLGKAWIKAAKTYDGETFFRTVIPSVYSIEFYDNNIEWLRKREKLFIQLFTKEWYDAFVRLVISAESLNVTEQLHEINVPTLIIGSEYDSTTPLRLQEHIYKRIKDSKFVVIKGAGHASMYEKPYEFVSIVLGFLNTYRYSFNIV